jgi:serine/threonine-protein kinase PknK
MWLDTRYRREALLDQGVERVEDRLSGATRVLKRTATEREHAHLIELDHPALRSMCGATPEAIVLEHIEGETPSEKHDARAIAITLLRALLHLHERGRVHGDLKPANLLVDHEGAPKVIDLGLAVPIGTPVAGGTPGFVPPEYLRGAPASVAGDLYSLGRTLEAIGWRDAFVGAACAEDPSARPASAAAALSMLGELALPEDRIGPPPLIAMHDIVDELDAAVRRFDGGSIAVTGPRGAGHTRIARELVRRATRRREPIADGSIDRLAALLGGEGPLAERAMRAAVRAAKMGVAIVIETRADDDERDALIAMVRAVGAIGRGAVITIGTDVEGARTIQLPSLDLEQTRAVLRGAGARVGIAERLWSATNGRAGLIARAARLLARHPETTDEAACTFDEREPEDPRPPIERAREAIDRGASRRAERILRTLDETDESRALLGRALAMSGKLEEAEPLVRADRTLHARVLERLGRYEEALVLCDADPERAAIGASAALGLGKIDRAKELASGNDPKLALLRSDIALREGRSEDAVHAARSALERAPELAAAAHSRIGSALSMRGDVREARAYHARALEAAEGLGDVAGLAPYVMNLATAEHACGELGAAIARYEEAARLATALGRGATRAAALANLAGLLIAIGAREEAAPVLRDAAEAAERAGSTIYAAQVVLLDAERTGSIERAREANARFEAAGAVRQALEARLLAHELAADDEARRFCEDQIDELTSAGLGPRASVLIARVYMNARRYGDARRALERAITTDDSELRGRAHASLAQIHRALGTGEEAVHHAHARRAMEEVAATLAPGLAERFRGQHAEIFARSAPTAAPPVRLGDGGRRLLSLLRRVLLEGEERRVLEAAVDEAVALTRAERAFLLRRKQRGDDVLIARNLDRDTIKEGRFSRSVAERVMSTGEPVLTAMAPEDPTIGGARSIVDLGLRSILCVPVRAPYLDHRFETARFDAEDLELLTALADVIGLAIENARLHREARERARALEAANEQVRQENVIAAARVERLEQQLSSIGDVAEGIIGRSEPLRRALGVARRVAPSDLPVLIEGESGTGKEVLARYVHTRSLRSAGPLCAINCGALPESLLESELFGHVRGSFTGATRDHPGLFRTAQGGTVLLDEIGEMPARMQTRLLRVLQEREVMPVGASKAIAVDVRVIAATNRDLEEEVEHKRFRRDLFFRLVGVRIALPPLRERLDDLPLLAEHALEKIAREPGMVKKTVSQRALGLMLRHGWPGNVRELEQSLRRAVLVAHGDEIEPEDLALGGAATDRRTALRGFDRTIVEQALMATKGNRTEAARALGVSRMTLHRWIRRYEL